MCEWVGYENMTLLIIIKLGMHGQGNKEARRKQTKHS